MNFKYWEKIKTKVIKVQMKNYQFPCVGCVVRPICNFSKPCDQLEMDDNKIKDFFMKYSCCPDCGSEKFMEGPSGGMSVNIRCAGCGHWFNNTLPLSMERIRTPPLSIERIRTP